jgi:hypothetical protein
MLRPALPSLLTVVGVVAALAPSAFASDAGAPAQTALSQAEPLKETAPRQAFELLAPACERKEEGACAALERLVLSQRAPTRYRWSTPLAPDLVALFQAGIATGDERSTLICRVEAKESSFAVEWSLGPFAAGVARGSGGVAHFLVGGAGLQPGDLVRAGVSRQERGYGLGSFFVVGLPLVPGFGETRTYGLHRFQTRFERLPIQATDTGGRLECRAVPEKLVTRELAEPRADVAKARKRLAGRPRLRLKDEDLGLAESGASDLSFALERIALLLGWRHPEVLAALEAEREFEARWQAEVVQALPKLVKSAKVSGGLEGLRGVVKVTRFSCDPEAQAPYREAGDARCVLEVEADAGKEELVPQHLRLDLFQVLDSQGRLQRVEAVGCFDPKGTYASHFLAKAAPGEKFVVVLRVQAGVQPVLLGHKGRWFRLP